jgi:hypothetical protein
MSALSKLVMPGKSAKRVFALDVPGMTSWRQMEKEDVDGRDKPGHDGGGKCLPE